MSMSEWAKREVEIACKKENPDWDGKSFDYGCSCYQSALKAYQSLCNDGHSGYSFAATRNILEKLLWDIPLSPIDDNKDDWNLVNVFNRTDKKQTYQCRRRCSVFKDVDEYGFISYHDNERVVAYELNSTHSSHFGLADKIVNELYPVKMPYNPSKTPFKVYFETFLSDKNNGNYDMAAFFYLITPEGKREDVNRYFDLRKDSPVEISEREYFYIKNMRGEE